jgi:hypothetical protein
MKKNEINALPLESDVSLHQRAVDPGNTEYLTLHGRDRSLDYRISGIFAARGIAGNGNDR